MGAGASKAVREDQRRQQELEEQRRKNRPKVRNVRELRAALRGKEPEIALMQDCRFHLKSEQDVARERAEALQADQDARAELEKRRREFASETRPNMKREVTRQLELAEKAATQARALAESLTARDADTGGPLVIDRSVRLLNPGGPGARPQIFGGVQEHRLVQRSRLKISVMECRGLPKMDLFGANEVYVCLEVGIQKWKSSVDRSETDHPRWGYIPEDRSNPKKPIPAKHFGESNMFERTCSPGQRTSVRLAVWDEDKGSADDLIGEKLIDLPLNEAEAKRRPTYREEGREEGRHSGERPNKRRSLISALPDCCCCYVGIQDGRWECDEWFGLTDGQGKPAGECRLKLRWEDWTSAPVQEGGDDDPKAIEALNRKMTKEERYAEKMLAQGSAMPVLIEISKYNAHVIMEGIEIVGSTRCDRERCPFGALPRGSNREACKCVSETIQVWGGSLRIDHCELHGCIRANGVQAQVGLRECMVSGSQRPGVGVHGGALADIKGGSIEQCARGVVVSGSGRVVANAKMVHSSVTVSGTIVKGNEECGIIGELCLMWFSLTSCCTFSSYLSVFSDG
jgi:hypothetical protein